MKCTNFKILTTISFCLETRMFPAMTIDQTIHFIVYLINHVIRNWEPPPNQYYILDVDMIQAVMVLESFMAYASPESVTIDLTVEEEM